MSLILHIHLLGDFRLDYGDMPVMTVNTPRLQSLLAYLVLHRYAPQSRSHLAFLLWPDSTEAQARTNLRHQFHLLRQALPEADRFLQADAQTLQWRPDTPFTLDVADFESRVAQVTSTMALRKAVELYLGDLLPSCYDEWILPERERLRQMFIEALERLIGLLENERDYDVAIRYAQRLLHYDPLHEETYRHLMRLYALSGDRASALRAYHTCVTVLQRELAVEPSPTTHEAYERLLNAAKPVSPAVPSTTLRALSPLVGRQQEWAQLQAAWRKSSDGHPHLVLLAGEAGIGKTRLAEELLQWASRQGIVTASAHCYTAEGELAYAPVTTWLRARPLPPLDPLWLSEVARLLPEILLNQPNLSPLGPLTEAWQRQRLFEALARAILGGSQPLLLLIDDLQWCDHDTLEWLHYLLRFDPRARLLIIGTLRSEEMGANQSLASFLLALRHDGQLIELELNSLDEAETVFLATHVADQELDSILATHLYQETEGNPLFVVETMRAGLSRGARVQGSRGEAPRGPPTPLPPRVQAVIETRLTQLSPPARELARLAATIGRAFTFAVLAHASGAGEDTLVRGLDELWQRRIVREQGAEAYDFSHDKLREVTYAGLSMARRRLLHRRVAQALEIVNASNLDAISGQVAAHYERAGMPEQATLYYQRAAEVARRVYANEAAIDYYQKALALLSEGVASATQRVELYEGLGQSLRVNGQPEEAAEAYAAMRVAAEITGDRVAQARAWNGLSRTWFRHDYRAMLENAEQAELAAQAAGSQLELARSLFNKSWALFILRGAETALILAEQALELSRELDLRRELAQNLQLIGWIRAGLLEQYAQAIDYYEQALALFRELGDLVMVADTLNSLGEAFRYQGDYRAAFLFYQDALTMATKIGYRDGQIAFLNNLGGTRVGLGEYQAAEADLRQVIHMQEATQLTGLSEAYCFLAEAYLGQGKLNEALVVAWESLTVGEKTEQPEYIGGAWRVLGMVIGQGDLRVENVSLRLKGLDAVACFAESLRIFTEIGLVGERARTLRAWAKYEMERGNKERGEAMWQKAREAFAQLELGLELARMDNES